MLRNLLLGLSHNKLFRRAVVAFTPTRRLVSQFVAGETVEDALVAIRSLVSDGLMATVDHLGEGTTNPAQAQAAAQAYLPLLDALSQEGLADRVEVSVKLSALGLSLPDGEQVALANLRLIAQRAHEVGTTVTLDMEDHATADATLAVLAAIRDEYPQTGAVLQAYLRRTPADCRRLASARSRVRLCKGAYDEPSEVALRSAGEIRSQYLECLRILMKGDGYPMVASHDPVLIEAALGYAELLDRTPDSYEFQMLYGIRVAEQKRLADAGHRVRIYVPFGTDWYGYFMRRLAERPANLLFFMRAVVGR